MIPKTQNKFPFSMAAKPQERGAPAVAGRLEKHEQDAEQDIIRLKSEIQILLDAGPGEGDDEVRKWNNQLSSLRDQKDTAYDLWFKLSKEVRDYDKAVKADRREGEKVAVSEAKEIFQQYELTIDLALEDYAIVASQEMFQLKSPQEIHMAHAEQWRTAKATAKEKALKDGVIPKWLIE